MCWNSVLSLPGSSWRRGFGLNPFKHHLKRQEHAKALPKRSESTQTPLHAPGYRCFRSLRAQVEAAKLAMEGMNNSLAMAQRARKTAEKEVAQVRVQGIPGRVDTSESGRHRMPFGGAEECFPYFYDTSD